MAVTYTSASSGGAAGWITPHERSMALLARHLTEAQRQQFDSRSYFEVRGRSGRLYQVHFYASGNRNVVWVRRPKWRCISYGCAPRDGLPTGDKLLAQKLALETNDLRFRFKACAHRHDGKQIIPLKVKLVIILAFTPLAFSIAHLFFRLAVP